MTKSGKQRQKTLRIYERSRSNNSEIASHIRRSLYSGIKKPWAQFRLALLPELLSVNNISALSAGLSYFAGI